MISSQISYRHNRRQQTCQFHISRLPDVAVYNELIVKACSQHNGTELRDFQLANSSVKSRIKIHV